jgi:hypothetical protein
MKKREKTKATQNDSKEEKEKVPKTKNKDEVLLSATCSGGVTPKKKVTFCH